MPTERPTPPQMTTVFCGLCRQPHVFEHRPGLQYRDCNCGGGVSLHVKTDATRWTYLEVDL